METSLRRWKLRARSLLPIVQGGSLAIHLKDGEKIVHLTRAHLFRQRCGVEPQATRPLDHHGITETDADLIKAVDRFAERAVDRRD